MSQRSIFAGTTSTIVIKAGASVTVKGVESEFVTANTHDRWGLQVDKRNEAEFARARAAIGEVVLFDVHLIKPGAKNSAEEVIEVQMGGSGEVQVPVGSNLKIYAGKDIDVQGIRGKVDAYSGFDLHLQEVFCLGNASAGRHMLLDCETLLAEKAEFTAGGDLRFYIHDLNSTHIRVKDLGGFWEATVGKAEKSISLKCGGDLTLVTDQKVEPLPPNYILGKIERPQLP